MKPPVCRQCGGKVLHGNLWCSMGCESVEKANVQAHAKALEAQGFQRDPEIENVYLKDGIATTLEHVAHVGLAKAIQHHSHAVANRKAI